MTPVKISFNNCVTIIKFKKMAKLRSGILDGFSGKVGTVVGSIWNGICTIRLYNANPSNPKSPAQLEQRAKFGTMIKFLLPLTAFLRLGFASTAIKMTALNAAMKANIKEAITGIYPAFEIDYTKAMVSVGKLAEALNPAITSTTAAEIDFTWEDNSFDYGAESTDVAMCVVYNPTKGVAKSFVTVIPRNVGAYTAELPNSYSGDEVQCYLAFKSATGNVVSNSQYVSSLIVT